ncbi:amidase [Silvibacterium acidisoli]|uniref:amidase n=1 Tax=Acidobacteriaceae bacterium ZG23-2 TaxID=2883246 RepID=UPI00406C5F8E
MQPGPSPIEKALAHPDPEALASEALDKANSNAGRNVYLARDAEWTLAQARHAAQHRKAALRGLPIALKDCFDLAGFTTSCGSRYYAEINPAAEEDSWVAERLKQAGAVITGKTHMQQLAYGITGENADYGDCVQPADATSLTGGSSSGSAAAVQEGSAIAAIGTDTGGSIRVPAALCGLAGYRASHGLGDWRGGAHLAQSFDTIGWLCRDLRDLPRLAQAVFELPAPTPNDNPIVVGRVSGALLNDCEPSVMDAMEHTLQQIAAGGAAVVDIDPFFWTEAFEIYAPLQAIEAAKLHAGRFEYFEPGIADRLRWGASIPSDEARALEARHRSFVSETIALMSGVDFLLMPALPLPRLAAGADHSAVRAKILRYTTPASLAGLPSVVLPAKPCGMQLLAPRFEDRRLLAFAASLAAFLP